MKRRKEEEEEEEEEEPEFVCFGGFFSVPGESVLCQSVSQSVSQSVTD